MVQGATQQYAASLRRRDNYKPPGSSQCRPDVGDFRRDTLHAIHSGICHDFEPAGRVGEHLWQTSKGRGLARFQCFLHSLRLLLVGEIVPWLAPSRATGNATTTSLPDLQNHDDRHMHTLRGTRRLQHIRESAMKASICGLTIRLLQSSHYIKIRHSKISAACILQTGSTASSRVAAPRYSVEEHMTPALLPCARWLGEAVFSGDFSGRQRVASTHASSEMITNCRCLSFASTVRLRTQGLLQWS